MILTNKEIMDIYEALGELRNSKEKIGIKISYLFAKDERILEPFYKAVMDTRHKIIREHATLNEDHDYVIQKEHIPEVNKLIEELLEVKNQIELDTISMDDLKETNFEFKIISGLYPIIK